MTAKERKQILALLEQIKVLIELDARTFNPEVDKRAGANARRRGNPDALARGREVRAANILAEKRAKLQAQLDEIDDKLTTPTKPATNGAAQ